VCYLKEEMQKMHEIGRTKTEALKKEMRQLNGKSETENSAHKEAIKKVVLDLEAQKAAGMFQKKVIEKLGLDLEAQKVSQETSKATAAAQKKVIGKLMLDVKKLQEHPIIKSEPQNADKENTKQEPELLDVQSSK